MIQLGLFAINFLSPLLLAGFSIYIWTVPALHWHWLFWIPPLFTAVIAILMMLLAKPTPEDRIKLHSSLEAFNRSTIQVLLKKLAYCDKVNYFP